MDVLSRMYVHTVTVKSRTGSNFGSSGSAADVTRACWVDGDVSGDMRAGEGDQNVAKGTRIFDSLDGKDVYAVGSTVVLPSGRSARVTGVTVYDSGALGLGLDHIEVALT